MVSAHGDECSSYRKAPGAERAGMLNGLACVTWVSLGRITRLKRSCGISSLPPLVPIHVNADTGGLRPHSGNRQPGATKRVSCTLPTSPVCPRYLADLFPLRRRNAITVRIPQPGIAQVVRVPNGLGLPGGSGASASISSARIGSLKKTCSVASLPPTIARAVNSKSTHRANC